MRGCLETVERVDVQFFVDAFRETMTEAGHSGKQLHWIDRATESLELCPVTGSHHLHERGGNATSNAGQAL